jgi:fructokinase
MKQIVCYGEVLWDMLPTGKKLGGAPLNVALRAQSFGHKAIVISSIGNDSAGKEILEHMKLHGAELNHIQVSNNFSTSEVLVKLDASGSASYEIKMPCAWDDIQLMTSDLEVVSASDAFIYGSLIARQDTSRETLFSLIEKAKYNVFDVNLRPPHYGMPTLLHLMGKADFIKFNDEELFEICADLCGEKKSLEDSIRFMAEKTNTSQICVTLGEKGAVLFINNTFVYNTGYKITVADTVGAGDSFLASLISQLLNCIQPQTAIDYACAVGGIVASKRGANPSVSAEEIEKLLKSR